MAESSFDRRVLVLGGTGWVGHHVARCFDAAGWAVTVGSRGKKCTFDGELSDRVHRVTADKEAEDEIAPVLAAGYDVVVDTVPTERSLELVHCHAAGLEHYLHCSSTGGYAPLARVPGDETCPYDHFHGGWRHKQLVDAKASDLFHREGFPATVLRPSYITGPGMLPLDNRGGRREDFIDDVVAGRPIDLPGDGQALLQPIHVRELARAFRLAAERPATVGQVYNICLARAVPLWRYVEITAAALGRTAQIETVPVETMLERYRDGGDPVDEIGLRFLATHMCFDIGKARRALGYEPRVTTEQAIRETARWAARQRGHAIDA